MTCPPPRLNPSTAAMRLAGAVSPDNKVDFHGTTRSKRRKVREKLPQRLWLKDEGTHTPKKKRQEMVIF